MRKEIKIGMFGYGCVGQGLHDVLNCSPGFKTEIVKFCVKHKEKERRIPMHHFTFDKDDILENPDINLVVELIDNAEDAYDIVTTALKKGKNVVSANKKLIAEHLEELIDIQKEHNVSLLYEASCCASIPILRNLEEYYDNELLTAVRGIFNGSSNYIVSKMFDKNMDYDHVLKEAQLLGFAESNPALDVEGIDAKFKLVIIIAHAYGVILKPEQIFHFGIQNISANDIQFAKEKGCKIKLVPCAMKLDDHTFTAFVMPLMVSRGRYLYSVNNEYNGVITIGAFADKQFFFGKGAGGHPTGAAVMSDISANTYDYKYEYKKMNQEPRLVFSPDYRLEVYMSYEDEHILEHFHFEKISERHFRGDYNYIIGILNIKDLLRIQDKINEWDVFITSTGRSIDNV